MNLSKEFSNLEKSAVKMTVTVPNEEVKNAYSEVVKKYAKNLQIPGFRKGHVPQNILEKKYGDSLKAEAMAELIDKSVQEIFDDEKDVEKRPLPYEHPVMQEEPKFDLETDLVYSITYDVYPKADVKNFSGIVIKEVQVSIGDKELNEELKGIQEQNAVVMDKKDGETVAKDDIVTINYSELDENGSEISGSKREGFVFTVGSGENIYKIDDEIIGMKKDETKSITKTYDAKDENEELAGKTKKISVTVTALKIRDIPALDDDLAQDVNEKFKTLDDLKKDIMHSLEVAKDNKIKELKNQSLLEQLVEKNPFDIPQSMLNAELQGRWQMMARQFQTTAEQLEKMVTSMGKTKAGLMTEWAAESEKMLKSRIIVENLIKERNITATLEEIDAWYAKVAEDNNMSIDDVKKRYEDASSKEYVEDTVKEDKLYDELYKEVKVTKGDKIAFADLFKAQ